MIPKTVSLSSLQFQVSHNTIWYKCIIQLSAFCSVLRVMYIWSTWWTK